MSFIQWCCERGAKSHRKRTKKPWRKRQSRSWRYSFHKYFTTFFYLFLFFNYFTLSLFFYTFFYPRPLPTTHDPRHLATLFTNMRILRFKSQLTIAVFAAVNYLNEPLRKQNFTLTGSKGHGLWFVIGGIQSVLCVSVFQGSLLVIVIMIDGSEKRDCEGGFWNFRVRIFVKSAVRQEKTWKD